ncbi:hypothetical protein SDC9_187353 [bioreactor metagenome]|uniref:Uncharacterized protein n=1 Tax=bioreactor metagenome TaxID=1076179 RepID=A0A645HNK0_9ZZZZ
MQFQALRRGMGQQQQTRNGGLSHERIDRMPHRHTRRSVSNTRQPLRTQRMVIGQLAQHSSGDVGRVGQCVGQRVIAHLLQKHRPIHIAHTQAAKGLGDGQTHQALLGNLLPQFRTATRFGFPDIAQQFGGGLRHEKAADRVAKGDLVFGEGEIHGCSPWF